MLSVEVVSKRDPPVEYTLSFDESHVLFDVVPFTDSELGNTLVRTIESFNQEHPVAVGFPTMQKLERELKTLRVFVCTAFIFESCF